MDTKHTAEAHHPGTKALAAFWDEFSPLFTTHMEAYNMPMSLQLALQTHFDSAKTVLETGSGSGLASTLIRNILRPGTTYCCLDLSKAMIELFKKRYDASEFLMNPANELAVHEETSRATFAPKEKSGPGLSLQAFRGDSESLPFVDSCFNAYIAPASVYLVTDAMKMIHESYRVLKKGGMAGFSVFGKMKDSTSFNVMSNIMGKYYKKYGVDPPKKRSPFYLGEDESALAKMFTDAGYSKVKMWHEHTVYPVTAQDYLTEKTFTVKETMAKFSSEVRKAIEDEIVAEVQKRFVDGGEIMAIDFVMVICTK